MSTFARNVKLFLPNNEIRRFNLKDQTFSSFCTRVKEIGNIDLQTDKNVQITYLDKDGDQVALSTPEEFKTCLQFSDATLKFTITNCNHHDGTLFVEKDVQPTSSDDSESSEEETEFNGFMHKCRKGFMKGMRGRRCCRGRRMKRCMMMQRKMMEQGGCMRGMCMKRGRCMMNRGRCMRRGGMRGRCKGRRFHGMEKGMMRCQRILDCHQNWMCKKEGKINFLNEKLEFINERISFIKTELENAEKDCPRRYMLEKKLKMLKMKQEKISEKLAKKQEALKIQFEKKEEKLAKKLAKIEEKQEKMKKKKGTIKEDEDEDCDFFQK